MSHFSFWDPKLVRALLFCRSIAAETIALAFCRKKTDRDLVWRLPYHSLNPGALWDSNHVSHCAFVNLSLLVILDHLELHSVGS